jgi:hypothetical protein
VVRTLSESMRLVLLGHLYRSLGILVVCWYTPYRSSILVAGLVIGLGNGLSGTLALAAQAWTEGTRHKGSARCLGGGWKESSLAVRSTLLCTG